MKEVFKPIALATAIYGGMYVSAEALHTFDCPKEDLHSFLSEDHQSDQMKLQRAQEHQEHLAAMAEMEEVRLRTQESFDNINRTIDRILVTAGRIEGMLEVSNRRLDSMNTDNLK